MYVHDIYGVNLGLFKKDKKKTEALRVKEYRLRKKHELKMFKSENIRLRRENERLTQRNKKLEAILLKAIEESFQLPHDDFWVDVKTQLAENREFRERKFSNTQ